ncbi:hypothetical protein BJ322DRAFT_231443 [Thelephora terrestris]|uniref:CFEM domain-containing protein n=1 Tax=Thelephora terrestris TaxID=56493 RepID=A0A9P6H8T8_9AGAM|nr:hypothetical protein BJ322DRAFT_231443 [Thelephora terrestris]
MRFSAVLVVLSASFATTSAAFLETRQSDYPDCAVRCLISANAGECGHYDTACLCKSEQFLSQINGCFDKSCSASDLAQSVEAAVAMCRAAGVTLGVSPTSTSSSTPSSTSSSSD